LKSAKKTSHFLSKMAKSSRGRALHHGHPLQGDVCIDTADAAEGRRVIDARGNMSFRVSSMHVHIYLRS
jgi:hypothetical protein